MTEDNERHCLYIGLGSNLGNRKGLIHEALRLVGLTVGRVEIVSSFYETEPQGFRSDHLFLNAAARVSTALSPRSCLQQTQRIERMLGRRRKSTAGEYHDRPIDIDLLYYDNIVMDEPDLTLPHPRASLRALVMEPLRSLDEATARWIAEQ